MWYMFLAVLRALRFRWNQNKYLSGYQHYHRFTLTHENTCTPAGHSRWCSCVLKLNGLYKQKQKARVLVIIQYDNNTIPNTRERASSSFVDVECTNPIVLFTIRLRIRMFVFNLSKCISLKRISYDWDIAERVSKEITERSKSYSPERALLFIHSVKNIRYSKKLAKVNSNVFWINIILPVALGSHPKKPSLFLTSQMKDTKWETTIVKVSESVFVWVTVYMSL